MGCVYEDRRSGRRILSIRYADVDGRERWERTDAATKALARRILSERENAVERARLMKLASVRDLIAPRPSVTLRSFANKEYMDHVRAHGSEESARRDESILRANVLPVLGDKALSEINAGHVQKYADDRLAQGRKPATVRYELMVISGIFREAIKSELIDKNPVRLVKKPRVDNLIVRYLDTEEEEKVLAFTSEPLRSAIIVAIHSGLREGEQLNLMWGDVRFAEGHIVVRNTKSKRDRIVPMSRTLRKVLERLPRVLVKGEVVPYVFTNPETETKFQRFNADGWRAALVNAGIVKFRWHDLRHTFASRLAQAGVPITVIKELMGHSTITVTMRYAHLAPSNLRSAVRALDPVEDQNEVGIVGGVDTGVDIPIVASAG